MTENEKEQIFLKYRGLARKLASRFAQQYNRPLDYMVDIAEYALALELFGRQCYNPTKGQLSSWLYRVIWGHLKNVCTRGIHPSPVYPGSKRAHVREWSYREKPLASVTEDGTLDEPAAPSTLLDRLQREVSEEGRELLKTVLSAPTEVLDVLESKPSRDRAQKARVAVRQHLVSELGWETAKIDRAWSELAACL